MLKRFSYSVGERRAAFTLVEVLLVVALLAILAMVTIVAINPSKHLTKSRDSGRITDVYSILSAVHQYSLDNDGVFPEVITLDEQEICSTGSIDCAGMADLSVLTSGAEYMESMPIDPSCKAIQTICTEFGTGYSIKTESNGKVTVSALHPEVEDSISVTR